MGSEHDETRRASAGELTPGRVARGGLAVGLYAAGVIGLLGIAAAVISGSQASAGGWFGKRHHGDGHANHERFTGRTEFAIDWILHRVDASDEQTDAIKEIVGASVEHFETLRNEEDHGARLAALLTAETVDEEALEAFRQEQLARVDRATSHLVETTAAIAAELTPEQRSELIELAREHGHGAKGRHGRWGRRL